MTINLSQMTLQPPQFGHGALVSARLPFVAANDAAGLQSAAGALGMTQVAANQFQHPVDGSWAVMNAGRVERGVGSTHFRGVPANLAALPTLPAGQSCAAVGISANLTTSQAVAQLTKAGFVESSKSFFAHPDGSWVAVTPDAGLLRGFGQNQLAASDAPQVAPPAARAPRATGRAAQAAVIDVMTLPQRTPTFGDGFLACAFPGRLDPAQRAAMTPQLIQQGFVETQPGHFEHPADKSWVAYTAQGTIERGVAGERFNRVPVNPTRLGQVNPQGNAFLLSVADPKLQSMTFAQVQKSDAALLAAGFTASNGVYSHPDGCFMAFTPNQTYVGQNQQIFATLPQALDMKNAIASRPEHAFFAVAKTGDLKAGSANLAQSLGGHGFAATVPGSLYSHTDGSWVAIQGNKLFRGVSAEVFNDVPKPPPPGSAVKDTSKPPLPDANNWAFWQQNMAIGKLPMLSGSTTDLQLLSSLGFAQIGNEWWHPDGSWVNFQASPPLGWKGYHLGNLPYNNRRPNG